MRSDHPSRKNPRLSCYNYSACGAYFVTICSHDRRRIFGKVCRDDPCGRPKTVLSELGVIAKNVLKMIEAKFDIVVDYFAVMPDHIHLILFLPDNDSTQIHYTLGQIIGAYKSIVANQWLVVCKHQGLAMGKIWQERYYDHIIRNDKDLSSIRSYIDSNPDRWLLKYPDE